jgi:hypothetical protein
MEGGREESREGGREIEKREREGGREPGKVEKREGLWCFYKKGRGEGRGGDRQTYTCRQGVREGRVEQGLTNKRNGG